jgi:hypothetical protein
MAFSRREILCAAIALVCAVAHTSAAAGADKRARTALAAEDHAEAPKTPNVVLLVIDGSRQLETIGDSTHTHIPHIWRDLRPQGALIPNFRNEGETVTNPGHSSILTGTWQHIANDGSERPSEPTLFEYYRRYEGVPENAVQLVSGKSKLRAVAWSTDLDYGKRYGAKATVGFENDPVVYEHLIPILERDHPRLVMACFPSVDHEGHSGHWDRYVAAIERADSLAGALWVFLQKDPHYAGNTYLFITNDHGRHIDKWGGFQNHGCPCEGCRRLLFLALGPDIKRGYVTPADDVYTQRDLCNTIARILGFPVEHSEGRVIEEIFAHGD